MTATFTPPSSDAEGMPRPVTIVGAGGHASVVATLIDCLATTSVEEIVETSDSTPGLGQQVGPYQVRRRLADLTDDDFSGRAFVPAVGDADVRATICETVLSRGGRLLPVVHPRANTASTAEISAGSVICALAHVGPNARIGTGAIVNTGAVVEHDCIVGDYAHIAPAAALAGNVNVGARSWVGLGANVINGVRVGSRVVIGAGAVVIDDVPSGCTAVGVPARPLRWRPETEAPC